MTFRSVHYGGLYIGKKIFHWTMRNDGDWEFK